MGAENSRKILDGPHDTKFAMDIIGDSASCLHDRVLGARAFSVEPSYLGVATSSAEVWGPNTHRASFFFFPPSISSILDTLTPCATRLKTSCGSPPLLSRAALASFFAPSI
jgi:hypothetical protein